MEQLAIDSISALIAGVAMVISYFAYLQSKYVRKEQGQAFLFIDVMQVDSRLYVMVNNIGNTFAYDVKITVSEPFVNRFSNLKLIQPKTAYRYPLLDSQDAGDYPAEVTFSVNYLDRYSKKKAVSKVFRFKLVDYMKYDIAYNSEFGGYDISKTY